MAIKGVGFLFSKNFLSMNNDYRRSGQCHILSTTTIKIWLSSDLVVEISSALLTLTLNINCTNNLC